MKIPAGSYVVRMDQPYSRMADMLLDTQYYNVNDPPPYDDTGWTLGALHNVKTIRVTDAAILKAPMSMVVAPAKFEGSVTGGSGAVAYLINNNTDNTSILVPVSIEEREDVGAGGSLQRGWAEIQRGDVRDQNGWRADGSAGAA